MDSKRKYQSEVREKSKQMTIESIIESTYNLHSEGITDIKLIAENAGVSVPTIRKYFPTNEDLFRGCANHFLKVNRLPEIYKYIDIKNMGKKVHMIVKDFYFFHEQTLETVWLSYRLAEQSKVMKNSTLQNEAIIKAAVEVMLQDITMDSKEKKQIQGFIKGLLHPLFYRALRMVSRLSVEDCIKHTEKTMINFLREKMEN